MEGLLEKEENLELRTLEVGSRLIVLAEDEIDGAFRFDFLVYKTGDRPACYFMQTNPNGTSSEIIDITLLGTGSYTTQQQNPVQHQLRAFSTGYGCMWLGATITILSSGISPESAHPERYILYPDCTSIEILPSTVTPHSKVKQSRKK